MFIRAGLKEHIIALCAAVTGDRIRQHDLVSVSDVRLAGSIGDRRGDIVRFLSMKIPPVLLQSAFS